MAAVQLEMPNNIILSSKSSSPNPTRISEPSTSKHPIQLEDIHHWSDDGEVSVIRGADIPTYLDLIDDIYSPASTEG